MSNLGVDDARLDGHQVELLAVVLELELAVSYWMWKNSENNGMRNNWVDAGTAGTCAVACECVVCTRSMKGR